MTIQVKNNMLNLAELQERLDNAVFEHIDTAQNWHKAQAKLHPLYSQAAEYFKDVVERNGGGMPKENSYWMLFMHTVSRLVYFENLIKHSSSASLDENAKHRIADGYITAARILPNCHAEDNDEFFGEINKSLQQLTDGKMTVEKADNPLSVCFQVFYHHLSPQAYAKH
ncbi:MAG: hypothetical protein ACI33P_12720 [Lysinibacillus sp.]